MARFCSETRVTDLCGDEERRRPWRAFWSNGFGGRGGGGGRGWSMEVEIAGFADAADYPVFGKI
jgi:hypothetical protein